METNFELQIADTIKEHIDNIENVAGKFESINALKTVINKIDHELAFKYVYCEHCLTYIERASRVRIERNDIVAYYCSECGSLHRYELQ